MLKSFVFTDYVFSEVCMDIKLYFREKGNGSPLILLHGNGESSEYFENQIEFFSKYFHVYAIDSRGHGRSPFGKMPFTIKQFAEDVYDFMNKMSIKKAHILGYSDGANVAMYLARKYGEKVDKLVLYSGNISSNGVKWLYQFPIEIAEKLYNLLGNFSKKILRKSKHFQLMTHGYDLTVNDLADIKAKTLVIAGTNDMIKETHTRMIKNAIKNSTLKILKGGHNVSYTNPTRFNEEVLRFLR